MPNTILSQLIEKINTLENIPVTAIEHKFSKSRFNSHSVYRITDVDVRIKTHKSVSEIRDLHIAYSMPVTNPMYTKNLKAAIAAENTLIRKKIDSSFNHIYFYRGDNGCLISQFTPYSDLFNFSMSDALSNYCSLDNFRHLSAQILLAVNAYHSKQLVHRDIKPENFLVFEQDGLYILKLSDHDDVIEVYNSGIAIVAPDKRVGSGEYRSPEYIVDAQVLAMMDYKANDCYAVGITLKHLYKRMLVQSEFQANTVNSTVFRQQLQYFYQLMEELTSPKPESRLTIKDALDSQFFGISAAQNKKYLNAVHASAKHTFSISAYPITRSVSNLNDPHYLLPPPLKIVYQTGLDVAHLINVFQPCFYNFNQAKISKYAFRQIKTAANKHIMLAKSLEKNNYTATLHRDLREFELELQSHIKILSNQFLRNLSSSIKHVIDESIKTYTREMEGAIKRGLSPAQPSLFQRLNYNFAAELNEEITPETAYQEAFRLITNFIGKHRGFCAHTFKNILMKNLLHVLHESLENIRGETDDETAHVHKRARFRLALKY